MSEPDYKDAARRLWMLLDDIDTLDDACRADDAAFRKHARDAQRKRFAILNGKQFDALTAPPALQHQEVPREPVARPSMSMYASAADYSAAMDGWIAATRQCPACRGKFGVDCQACDLCNATGRVPSTTRQQEEPRPATGLPSQEFVSSPMPPAEEERLLEHAVRAAIQQFGPERFARALATRQQEVGSGWIAISKRLPEAGQTVLAYWPREDRKADVAGWQFATAQFWPGDPAMWHNPEDDEDDYVAPSHWQPLASAPSTPEKGEKDDATCPAHGGRYHWTQDCPECTKDARARGMSMDDYYSQVRPTLRTPAVQAPEDAQILANVTDILLRAGETQEDAERMAREGFAAMRADGVGGTHGS